MKEKKIYVVTVTASLLEPKIIESIACTIEASSAEEAMNIIEEACRSHELEFSGPVIGNLELIAKRDGSFKN